MTIDPLRRRLLAAAAVALPWPALALAKTKPTSTASGVKLPPLALRQRTLANGLQVIALPDASSATVSVQVWYRVGGKDDPAGRSGFAHLFEHMMFKSTQNMPNEMFDRLTEDVGGQNNAFTAEDVTAYQNEVPANHLERLLWAEAERMAHLNIDQANFDSERAVVQEELRQRVLADPYGRLFNALAPETFELHPYKRPVIGSIEDLNAAGLDDVRAFHATYYRPDNALLIVAGGLDPAQFDAWVDRYFGALARPDTPIPRVTAREPRRSAPKRVALHGPSVPLPAVALCWAGPPARHPDAPALQVASALLSAGDSSRMNEALVYRARSAQAAGFSADMYADASLLTAYAIAASGRPLAQLETALMQQIESLANKPVPKEEMAKVRNRLLTAALLERQTPQGRAQAAGWAAMLHGDVRHAERELAELQAVRSDDVRRALKRHVLGAQRVSLHYTQGAA